LFKTSCPHCHTSGCLIKHSKIYRTSNIKGKYIFHGQRVFCNNRDSKKGCGHTFALTLTVKLPRLNRFTSQINSFLIHYITSLIACLAWNMSHPDCTDITASYRFLKLVKRSFFSLKALLCTITKPPDHLDPKSALSLFQHIQSAFSNSKKPLEDFLLFHQKRLF